MLTAQQAKERAFAFLEGDHIREGRPHPDEAVETALENRDADFVLAYVEFSKSRTVTAGYFWYYVYSTDTNSHEEFMAKFGAPKAKTDGFYPGETVTVHTHDGGIGYVGTVVDIEPCDKLRVFSEELGEETVTAAIGVSHGNRRNDS
jgi:hypothetical protein